MLLGTFEAGFVIVAAVLLITLVDYENKQKAEEFLNFE